jgi:Zn-dependent protease
MRFSQTEIRDLIKSWIAISLAFAIVMNGLDISINFVFAIIFAAITVGIGFIAHELGHKFLAQKYNCWAEFRSNDQMLFLAILFSFFGFIFAAPGAVVIQGHISKDKYGKISAMGPLMSFSIAIIFGLIGMIAINPIIKSIALYGYSINTWLGVFNLIPFGFFDGRKILYWNKFAYIGLVVLGIGLMFFTFTL